MNLDTESAIGNSQNLADAISELADENPAYAFNPQTGMMTTASNPFWRALADKAQLSADYISTTKSAERTYYGRNPWSENQNGIIVDYMQGSRGVLDARRDFEVGVVSAQASLQKNTQAAAGQRDRDIADAASSLAQARGQYEVSWAQMGAENHHWTAMESQLPIAGSPDGTLSTIQGAGTQFIPGLFQQPPTTITAAGTSTGFGGDDLDGYFSGGFLADGIGEEGQTPGASGNDEPVAQQAPNGNQVEEPGVLPPDDGAIGYEPPALLSGGLVLADWLISLYDPANSLPAQTATPGGILSSLPFGPANIAGAVQFGVETAEALQRELEVAQMLENDPEVRQAILDAEEAQKEIDAFAALNEELAEKLNSGRIGHMTPEQFRELQAAGIFKAPGKPKGSAPNFVDEPAEIEDTKPWWPGGQHFVIIEFMGRKLVYELTTESERVEIGGHGVTQDPHITIDQVRWLCRLLITRWRIQTAPSGKVSIRFLTQCFAMGQQRLYWEYFRVELQPLTSMTANMEWRPSILHRTLPKRC